VGAAWVHRALDIDMVHLGCENDRV
jgi:hypothetical protein